MKINGTEVVDARRPIRLHISRRDITEGDTKDPGACAAARAACRLKECSGARIHLSRTYLKIGEKWQRFITSQALKQEIIAFDRGGAFEAGIYWLNAPTKSLTAKAQRDRYHERKRQGPKTGTLRKKLRGLAVRHVTGNVRPRGANK